MKTASHSDSEREPAGSDVLVHPGVEAGRGGSLWHRLWTTPLVDLLRGRMSCRLDLRMIVAASGLPEAMGARVLETARRTRLSRREKAGIGGELVAHFADGLEAGESEDELLSGFGDARTTAKLIRRAKLRCRAWPRRVMRRMGQALAVLAVVYLIATIYYAAGRPKVSVDYLARMNAGVLAIPDRDRAWPVYREALLAMDRERADELLVRDGPEPGEAAWDDVARFIDDHEGALVAARRAAAMESLGIVLSTSIAAEDRDLWPEEYAEQEADDIAAPPLFRESPETLLVAVQIRHVMELMDLNQLFMSDVALATERNDGDRACESILAMLGMAGQLASEPMVIEQLVAMANVIEALEAADDVLRRRPGLLTDDHLRRLAHAFASEDLLPSVGLSGERLWFDDILQRIYTDDGGGDGHLVPGALRGTGALIDIPLYAIPGGPAVETREILDGPAADIALAPLANAAVASRKDMEAFYNRIMDRYQGQFARPYWEVLRSGEVADEMLSSMSMLQKIRYALVAASAPAFGRVYHAQQEAIGLRDGILAVLALQVHHRRHGDWPATLDELAPDLLPSVPRDRFTGEPLRYRVDGHEVIVYSVGRDLDDDGGVLPQVAPDRDPDQTPRERFRTINKRAGVRSYETPDGDWILWHSAPPAEILEGGAES